jgi:hypothetical protein
MNVEFLTKIPVMPLVLFWLAYNLLGWYLAAHHIVWLVAVFVVAMAINFVCKNVAWFESLISFGSQTSVIFLVLSASIALIATSPLLFSLFFIPLTATILADLELRFAGFRKLDAFLILAILAISSLMSGEMIDILIFPSSRY